MDLKKVLFVICLILTFDKGISDIDDDEKEEDDRDLNTSINNNNVQKV